LTTGLIAEIETLFPSRSEIQKDNDNKRDPRAFEHKIAQLFPKGRMFASFKQLDQAADMFLGAWAVKKTNHSKSIQCAYSTSHTKKDRRHADVSKRRKLEPTLKSVYKCPFVIRYSYVAYCKNKALKKPDIFYHVKITNVNFQHTCQMTTIFHRQALQLSGGLQPDLNGVNDIMSLLREKPMLRSDVLRPLLTKYLPFYKATDAQFIANFRIRAQHWLVANGDKELTMEEARALASKRPFASEEFLLSDDPMQKQNLTSLLRKVMQEDSCTWDALRFLTQMKSKNPGFDFRIKYDSDGRPEGVCWMLPEMRSDLLRFGNCLFLDSQKRQYNVAGWPYIGPVIKDSEMQVRCVAESIVVEESHRMYVWITQMLVEMEPRFSLDRIQIIFGDQALTERILVDLGIEETCTLRGDYYHLINEVWPSTFGTHLYQRIRGHLDRMLLGSKDEWEMSYSSAKTFLLNDAEKFSALEEIYLNPSHYAGWFLKKIEGNLFLNGSVPAEQNHSSVSAHLGAGASWSVVEQVSKLLTRQTHLTTKRRQKDSQAYVQQLKYRSRLVDDAGKDDEAAKKQLSHFAYDKLFLVEYKTSLRLQYLTVETGTTVWPFGLPQTCDEHLLIERGQRCRCHRRMAYNHQCKHELCIDGRLDLSKYSKRWLNRRTYNDTMPCPNNAQLPIDQQAMNLLFRDSENGQDLKVQGTLDDDDDSFGDTAHDLPLDSDDVTQGVGQNSEDVTLSELCNSENVTLAELARPPLKKGKLTYQFVAEKATVLVRLAQTDQVQLGSLCILLDQLTNRLRKGYSIEVSAFETSMPMSKENAAANPVKGTMKSAPNTYNHNRMHSIHETVKVLASKKRARDPLSSLVGHSNDLDHVAPPRVKNKTCSICRCPGHQRGSCPKIHKYKSPPLEMGKDLVSRHELSGSLSKVNRFKTDFRCKDDTRQVSISLPSRIMGIVIHQRFFINTLSPKMCVECTILGPMANAHSTFECYLFGIEVVSSYISKSKTNVVISELADACHEGYESFGFPMQPPGQHLSQLSQFGGQHLSQLSQHPPPFPHVQYGISGLSQAESDQMGYGQMSADL
jgi:hypothetical protein